MGKFSKFTGEVKLSVDVEGKPFAFKMKPTNRQIAKLMAQDKKKRNTEEGLLETDNLLIDMIVDANPPEGDENTDQHREEIMNFVTQKKVDIMTEFSIAMGWTTRDKIEKAIKEAEEKEAKEGKE